MALHHCGMVFLVAGAVLAPSHAAEAQARRVLHGTPAMQYSTAEAEHYLSAQQIEYVRPGLNITIVGVQIGADLKPIVEVTFADDTGQPLDRAGVLSPGALSLSFILAWYDPVGRYYTDYYTRPQTSPITNVTANQANTASGTWEDLAVGHAKFHFTSALPATYDVTKTHTLGIYATRVINLTDPVTLSKTYFQDLEYDFRPDGKAVTDTWNKMSTATCNQCHDPLAAHGETGRRDIKLCVLCHNPQTVDPDTGNSVDAKVFIHKIHMGSSLPSVQTGHPYQIIGYQQSVNDFSTVVFPQDIRNCTTCHKADSPQGFVWYTYPSRAACGSCHDNINWVTGQNHPAGPQPNDLSCASCHPPQGDLEWDAAITNAHTVPTKSAQLKGLKATIMGVTGATAGGNLTVTFKVTNNDGSPVDVTKLNSFNFLVGGPTKEYTQFFNESGKTATASGNAWVYSFKTALPANAAGTWTLSADIYRNITLSPAPSDPTQATVREAAVNPVFSFPVSDSTVVARRQVVDLAKCNKCHNALALHGGQRMVVQECVICHNPLTNDQTMRPASQGQPESVDFKRMIHRIHTGEGLTHDFTIFGYYSSPNPPNPLTFNDVRFPGDLRDCLACHVAGSYHLPITADAVAVPTLRDWYSPMQPSAAACLGCHDSKDAAAHAYVNTAPFGESCATCHGDDGEFSVDKVHAR